jgi:hypothetical protein
MKTYCRTTNLREDVTYSRSPRKVDRDKGVIYGVKVLGWESKNGRRYLPEDVRRKVHLYDGVPVNIDHPLRPGETRDSDARFGRLVKPRYESDGLNADLEFLKCHPMAPRICEAAARMPEVFGLSHNADGETRLEAGVTVVTSIEEVRSVDVVTQPATTDGLFEGHRRTRRTPGPELVRLCESYRVSASRALVRALAPLCESDRRALLRERVAAEWEALDSDTRRRRLLDSARNGTPRETRPEAELLEARQRRLAALRK